MTFTLDTSRLQQRLTAVRATLPASVPLHVDAAGRLTVLDSGYAAPMAGEAGPGPDLDEVVTDPLVAGQSAAVGIVQLYDWVNTEGHEHCQKCLDYAAGGPYTADFPDRPETVDTHSGRNPCWCIWAPRAFDDAVAAEDLASARVDIWQDLKQAWGT